MHTEPLSLEAFVRQRYPAPGDPGPAPVWSDAPARQQWERQADAYRFFVAWGYESYLIRVAQHDLAGLMALSSADYGRYLLAREVAACGGNLVTALHGRQIVRALRGVRPFLQPPIPRGSTGVVLTQTDNWAVVLFPAWNSSGIFGRFAICTVSTRATQRAAYPFDMQPPDIEIVDAQFTTEQALRAGADARYVTWARDLARCWVEHLPDRPGRWYVLKVYDEHGGATLIVAADQRPITPLKLPKRCFSRWTDGPRLPDGVFAVGIRERDLDMIARVPLKARRTPGQRGVRRAARDNQVS